MREGDLSIVSSTLSEAAKTLAIRWELAQQQWNDAAQRHFHETHIAPIEPRIVTALKAINRLSQIMTRAREEVTEGQS